MKHSSHDDGGAHSDARFQERQWRVQRAGWVVMGVVVLAALVGVLGNGPVSRARARSNTVEIEYPRFARNQSRCAIELRLMDSGSGRDLTVWFDRAFLDAFEVKSILPRSRDELVDAEGATFFFAGGPAPGPLRITWHVEPRHPGRVNAHVAAGGAAPLAFDPLVLP